MLLVPHLLKLAKELVPNKDSSLDLPIVSNVTETPPLVQVPLQPHNVTPDISYPLLTLVPNVLPELPPVVPLPSYLVPLDISNLELQLHVLHVESELLLVLLPLLLPPVSMDTI